MDLKTPAERLQQVAGHGLVEDETHECRGQPPPHALFHLAQIAVLRAAAEVEPRVPRDLEDVALRAFHLEDREDLGQPIPDHVLEQDDVRPARRRRQPDEPPCRAGGDVHDGVHRTPPARAQHPDAQVDLPFVEIERLSGPFQHDRGQVRTHLADEVVLDVLPLLGTQIGFGDDADPVLLEFAQEGVVGLEKEGLIAKDLALDVGKEGRRIPVEEPPAVGADLLDPLERRHPNPVVLVLVAREDAEETKPLDQRNGLVPRFLKDPPVERQLREFARNDGGGTVAMVRSHETDGFPGKYRVRTADNTTTWQRPGGR